jgi:hypothetical protein
VDFDNRKMMMVFGHQTRMINLWRSIASYFLSNIRLQIDILAERSYWIWIRGRLRCGKLPGEAICDVLLMKHREKHSWLRKVFLALRNSLLF